MYNYHMHIFNNVKYEQFSFNNMSNSHLIMSLEGSNLLKCKLILECKKQCVMFYCLNSIFKCYRDYLTCVLSHLISRLN